MSWLLAYTPVLALGLVLLGILRRRAEMRTYARSHQALAEARERGSHKARLQHPDIDLSQCIGCGACIEACPEEGVLDLLHGQAVVVHGARCVGHGRCATACPTGAIALTLGDLSDRRDLPAVNDELEAVGVPGLYLAGELGGFALVRTAVTQGVAVADAVSRRLREARRARVRDAAPAALDLLIVGAGPGGLACSLRAKELGLRFQTIEQEERIGGTVAGYPRRKLVMTQPVDLPLHGRLREQTYQKEDLIELWEGIARTHELPIRMGVRLDEVSHSAEGLFLARTSQGTIEAAHVCLALGRRGTPRKLGVPGEDLPKVAYSLIDAESYKNRRILVVGGGDSAIEAALGLAEQDGNQVTLSYRQKAFSRLKARNERRIEEAMQQRRLGVVFESEVTAIEPGQVRLRTGTNGSTAVSALPNDEVFIFAGGIPPFGLLEKAGVSFDPADRPKPAALADRGSGLTGALATVLLVAAGMAAWAAWHGSYYGLGAALRKASPLHALLRPAGGIGLLFGLAACALFACNLSYLVRRSARWGAWLPGTLRTWMTSHVLTGLLALLCVLVHAGFSARQTVGGHALAALAVVIVTGAIGRYFYAWVPRAANGAEVDLDSLQAQLGVLSAEWDRNGRGFGTMARDRVERLIAAGHWRSGMLRRIAALVIGQARLSLALRRLRAEGARSRIPDREVRRVVALARRAHRLTVQVTHYAEMRAVLSSWRYFHRWLALLLLLLAAVHIGTALKYAEIDWASLAELARSIGGGGP